ncbi:MAG: SHD1 domain-containing protein [Planctomycetota bacterium]
MSRVALFLSLGFVVMFGLCCGGAMFIGPSGAPSDTNPTSLPKPPTAKTATETPPAEPTELDKRFDAEMAEYIELQQQYETRSKEIAEAKTNIAELEAKKTELDSLAITAPETEQRTWQTIGKTFSVDAKLHDVQGTTVSLERSDNGAVVQIDVEKLIADDRIYVSEQKPGFDEFHTATNERNASLEQIGKDLAKFTPIASLNIQAPEKPTREAVAAALDAEKKAKAAAIAEAIANRPRLNKRNWLKVREGMTLQEVVAIVGNPSEELASNQFGNLRTVMFKWDAEVGFGNANGTFQNGKLVSKAQFGLR